MTDKTLNEIALKQMEIKELKDIKKSVAESIDDDIELTLVTKHTVRFFR